MSGGLTHAQKVLHRGQRLHPDAPLYNMALAFEIEGEFDRATFVAAYRAVTERCDALRTVVDQSTQTPRLVVKDAVDVDVHWCDVASEEDAKVWIRDRARRIFDLQSGLTDVAVLRLAADRHIWFLNQHHLITDGWSTGLMFSYMSEAYELADAGRLDELPPRPSSIDRAPPKQTPRRERALAHWKDTPAAPDRVVWYGEMGDDADTRTDRVTVRLGPSRTARLTKVATEPDVRALSPHQSRFNILATVLLAHIARSSDARDCAIATPVHNRLTPACKQTVGLFMELFALRVVMEDDDTFASLLAKVRAGGQDILRFALPGTSDPAHDRDASVVLNYVHAQFGAFAGRPVRSRWVHAGHGDGRHDLRLQVHDFDLTGDLTLQFDFKCSVFDETRRAASVVQFLALLDAFIDDRTQSIGAVRAVPETVLDHFAGRVAVAPDALAITHGDRTWTYEQLDRRADAYAEYLAAHGVGRGARVAICMARSAELVAAVLGVLRAGAAYVPLDPSHPKARHDVILADANPAATLTDDTVVPDAAFDARASVGRADVAYVLHTSGSTGVPKGVVVDHRALGHYVEWAAKFYARGRKLSFALFTSLGFDLTVTSLFVPLVTGGRIVIHGDGGGLDVLAVAEADDVDVIKATPSHLALVRRRGFFGRRASVLIVGGEDFKADLARSIFDNHGSRLEIYNEYGPTEATVGCMIQRYDPAVHVAGSVPIGVARAGMQVELRNGFGQPVPSGVTGEICIGGPALARGYFGRADPAAFAGGEYRTGDRARVGPHGEMQYLGRDDDELKVNGVRVERGEVEAAVMSMPVEACAVALVQPPTLPEGQVAHCARCGLSSRFPGTALDDAGVCETCHRFERYRSAVDRYFGSMDDLRAIFDPIRSTTGSAPEAGRYDCLALLSGGKDSTYMLCKLMDMGLSVLALTLDNGFISEGAKDNVRRVVEALGVDHMFATTPAMNAIFVDSLQRHSNVCHGCFKTIYTLSLREALGKHIPIIVTGLSRGQMFETRLTEELFAGEPDNASIDRMVLQARRAYHRVDDTAARLLCTDDLTDDAVFDKVRFVDFYRYCDVELDEMLEYLGTRVPWVRPADTGRSTNCLINDVGIYVHKKERGFHNYSLPYSWDVRLGHKQRDAALEELDDDIDEARVQGILQQIGYGDVGVDYAAPKLVAYFVAPKRIAPSDVRAHVAALLPSAAIPKHFVQLDALPMTAAGKVDLAALPVPATRDAEVKSEYVAPRNETERRLATIWADLLRVRPVGVHDDFFELGGDSITAIQVSARALEGGLRVDPNQVFQSPTIARLSLTTAEGRASAPQGRLTGAVVLTAVQRRHLLDVDVTGRWAQSLVLRTETPLSVAEVDTAVRAVVDHHDALRLTVDTSLAARIGDETDAFVAAGATIDALLDQIDVTCGRLVAVGVEADRLTIVIHHVAVDTLSWAVVIEDLGRALRGAALVEKTTSVVDWSSDREVATQVAPSEFGETVTLRSTVGLDATKGLTNRSSDDRVRADELLVAAFARALTSQQVSQRASEGTADAPVSIDIERHGRDGAADVSRTVGCFTELTRIDVASAPDPWTSVERVRAATPLASTGRAAGLFNYLGRLDRSSLTGALSVVRPLAVHHASPRARRYDFDVSCWLEAEGLTIEVTTHETADSAGQLLDAMRRALTDILRAGETRRAEAQPADFPLANLDAAKLDKLANALGRRR